MNRNTRDRNRGIQGERRRESSVWLLGGEKSEWGGKSSVIYRRAGHHAGDVNWDGRRRSTGHGSDNQTRILFGQQHASVALQFSGGRHGLVRRRRNGRRNHGRHRRQRASLAVADDSVRRLRIQNHRPLLFGGRRTGLAQRVPQVRRVPPAAGHGPVLLLPPVTNLLPWRLLQVYNT